MSHTVPLYTSATVTLDAQGQGVVQLGPRTGGHQWDVTMITTTTTSILPTQFYLYRNVLAVSGQIGGSWSGNQDFNETDHLHLYNGEQLIGQWIGGTSGGIATMIVTGMVIDPRNR